MCWLWIKTQARACVCVRACKDSGLVGSSSLIAVSLCWCESTEELRGERHLLSGGIFGLIHSNASKCGTETERAGATSGRARGAESSASGRLAATRSHTPFPQKTERRGREVTGVQRRFRQEEEEEEGERCSYFLHMMMFLIRPEHKRVSEERLEKWRKL